jgi:hypothetical protein
MALLKHNISDIFINPTDAKTEEKVDIKLKEIKPDAKPVKEKEAKQTQTYASVVNSDELKKVILNP